MRLQVFFTLAAVMLSSCLSSPDHGAFSVTTYNAYCFFDGVGDGDEFEGFRKADGYTEAVYDERVRNTAVMLGLNADADVIILQEIESEIVLRDLIEHGLDKKGYRYYGLAGGADDVISVGFISRLEPAAVRMHSFAGERPILELAFLAAGERITVFGVHLRSRIDDGNDDLRRLQLEHLASLIGMRNDSFVIVAGDFNLDPRMPDEAAAVYPEMVTPDTVISVSADPGRVHAGVMYAPIFDDELVLSSPGTYFFDGSWYIYDSIITGSEGADGTGLELEEIDVIVSYELLDQLSRPLRFDSSTGRGFSDHLPVMATFRRL